MFIWTNLFSVRLCTLWVWVLSQHPAVLFYCRYKETAATQRARLHTVALTLIRIHFSNGPTNWPPWRAADLLSHSRVVPPGVPVAAEVEPHAGAGSCVNYRVRGGFLLVASVLACALFSNRQELVLALRAAGFTVRPASTSKNTPCVMLCPLHVTAAIQYITILSTLRKWLNVTHGCNVFIVKVRCLVAYDQVTSWEKICL